MNPQSVNKRGLANNLWLELTALTILTIVVLALAAKYVWQDRQSAVR